MKKNLSKYLVVIFSLAVIILAGLIILKKPVKAEKPDKNENIALSGYYRNSSDGDPGNSATVIKEAKAMPVYGNWRNFTTLDGLPSDKAYAVRVDDGRVLVGTHDGLAVYENGKWETYTTEDGLAHNGVVSIDVSQLTGDVWIGTLGGLNRWSGGKFETFNQFNSGMPNDLVYNVFCYGNDIWVATGGGAGHYDKQTKQREIFNEQNDPMHEQ